MTGFSPGSSARRRRGRDTAPDATVDLYMNMFVSHGIRILGAGNTGSNDWRQCRSCQMASRLSRQHRRNRSRLAATIIGCGVA